MSHLLIQKPEASSMTKPDFRFLLPFRQYQHGLTIVSQQDILLFQIRPKGLGSLLSAVRRTAPGRYPNEPFIDSETGSFFYDETGLPLFPSEYYLALNHQGPDSQEPEQNEGQNPPQIRLHGTMALKIQAYCCN